MFQNYFKIALRNLMKNRVYSVVNILSLVIGLVCGMLIIVYVLDEISYDRFHDRAGRIYRLGRKTETAEQVVLEPLSCAPAARALMTDFPDIENAVRIRNTGNIAVRYGDKMFYEKHIAYADAPVFDVFTFPMIEGDAGTALTRPYSAVITEDMASKYFGIENPVGKILRFNNQHDYMVTGVMQNVPDNSHFEFDMLCSMETLAAQKDPDLDNWLSFGYFTYVLLKENAAPEDIQKKLPAFVRHYIGDDFKVQGKSIHFFLHPLLKIQLYSHLEGYPPGRIVQVCFLSMFALCIILAGCMNFMNLAVARSVNRSREVGIRKVIGANRKQLMVQFTAEAVILSLISMVVAMILVKWFLPAFSTVVRQQLTLDFTARPELLLYFIGLSLIVGIVSGSYPAFYLSRVHPADILKGRFTAGARKVRLRNALVLFQFFTSAVFIIQASVFGIQLEHLRDIDPGFDKNNVLVVPVSEENIRQSMDVFKKELRKEAGVTCVAATSTLPGWYIPREMKIPQGYTAEQMQIMDDINVDHGFIPAMGIEIIAGRNFSEDITTDPEQSVIINETAAQKFGWEQPVGKTIQYSTGNGQFATGTVCGVVRDFHLASLYRVIEPLFISNHAGRFNYLLVRFQPENVEETMDRIRHRWLARYPDHPFEYSFLDDSYDYYFQVVEKVMHIFSYFIFLTIFIACLGIFALAAYNAERRVKEIGIRKVLGAPSLHLVLMLNREIMLLVCIAMAAAVAFFQIPFLNPSTVMPYFTDFKPVVYLKSTLIVILMALVTISYQSIRAAAMNPVDSIRIE